MSAIPWLAYREGDRQAWLRLICVPYGGGGASIYRHWQGLLPPWVEVCAVQLPGRETRSQEAPYRRLQSLIESLASAIRPCLDRPYALFGHSLGALVCFELARRLRQLGQSAPHHLFASGCPGPRARRAPHRHLLSDARLTMDLGCLGGTPLELLRNPEFIRWYLPTFRADCELFETHKYLPDDPLSCNISAYRGVDDVEVSDQELERWSEETAGSFDTRVFPGGHLFLHEQQPLLLAAINSKLSVMRAAHRGVAVDGLGSEVNAQRDASTAKA